MRLLGMRVSGNCWKPAQILALTGHAFEWVETDANSGATRSPDFLAINPNGKVPALVLDDGTVLVESNAMLLHFAEGTPWLPPPGLIRTRVMSGCSSSSTATSPTSPWPATSGHGGGRRICTATAWPIAPAAAPRRWM
jgi:glutathione S-transferase